MYSKYKRVKSATQYMNNQLKAHFQPLVFLRTFTYRCCVYTNACIEHAYEDVHRKNAALKISLKDFNIKAFYLIFHLVLHGGHLARDWAPLCLAFLEIPFRFFCMHEIYLSVCNMWRNVVQIKLLNNKSKSWKKKARFRNEAIHLYSAQFYLLNVSQEKQYLKTWRYLAT